MKTENIIESFKMSLIDKIKKESEEEIGKQVREFENQLRQKVSAKIVSFVDELKIKVSTDFDSPAPKVVIEVNLWERF